MKDDVLFVRIPARLKDLIRERANSDWRMHSMSDVGRAALFYYFGIRGTDNGYQEQTRGPEANAQVGGGPEDGA